MSEEEVPTVLVVDDQRDVAEAYTLWLSDEYDVRTATSGQQALEAMDESVDVVLLDRRMPQMSGDEVLAEIRERGYDCRVALVTAVDPRFDIVDMEFDDYVNKPVTREDLVETVERLLVLAEYDRAVQQEYSLARKQATLETTRDRGTLEDNEDYRQLRQRRRQLRERVDEAVEEMDPEALTAVLSELPGDSYDSLSG